MGCGGLEQANQNFCRSSPIYLLSDLGIGCCLPAIFLIQLLGASCLTQVVPQISHDNCPCQFLQASSPWQRLGYPNICTIWSIA